MKSAVLLICLSGAALVGCAYLPTSGPTAGEVIDRGVQENQIRYDVVDVDRGVVATLLAQPAESFRTRFGKYGKPAAPLIDSRTGRRSRRRGQRAVRRAGSGGRTDNRRSPA
jgi:hypothetical protein